MRITVLFTVLSIKPWIQHIWLFKILAIGIGHKLWQQLFNILSKPEVDRFVLLNAFFVFCDVSWYYTMYCPLFCLFFI